MPRFVRLTPVVLASLLAACGGGGDGPVAPSPTTVTISAAATDLTAGGPRVPLLINVRPSPSAWTATARVVTLQRQGDTLWLSVPAGVTALADTVVVRSGAALATQPLTIRPAFRPQVVTSVLDAAGRIGLLLPTGVAATDVQLRVGTTGIGGADSVRGQTAFWTLPLQPTTCEELNRPVAVDAIAGRDTVRLTVYAANRGPFRTLAPLTPQRLSALRDPAQPTCPVALAPGRYLVMPAAWDGAPEPQTAPLVGRPADLRVRWTMATNGQPIASASGLLQSAALLTLRAPIARLASGPDMAPDIERLGPLPMSAGVAPRLRAPSDLAAAPATCADGWRVGDRVDVTVLRPASTGRSVQIWTQGLDHPNRTVEAWPVMARTANLIVFMAPEVAAVTGPGTAGFARLERVVAEYERLAPQLFGSIQGEMPGSHRFGAPRQPLSLFLTNPWLVPGSPAGVASLSSESFPACGSTRRMHVWLNAELLTPPTNLAAADATLLSVLIHETAHAADLRERPHPGSTTPHIAALSGWATEGSAVLQTHLAAQIQRRGLPAVLTQPFSNPTDGRLDLTGERSLYEAQECAPRLLTQWNGLQAARDPNRPFTVDQQDDYGLACWAMGTLLQRVIEAGTAPATVLRRWGQQHQIYTLASFERLLRGGTGGRDAASLYTDLFLTLAGDEHPLLGRQFQSDVFAFGPDRPHRRRLLGDLIPVGNRTDPALQQELVMAGPQVAPWEVQATTPLWLQATTLGATTGTAPWDVIVLRLPDR